MVELGHSGAHAGPLMLVACSNVVRWPLATHAEEATGGVDGARGWLGTVGAMGMEGGRNKGTIESIFTH